MRVALRVKYLSIGLQRGREVAVATMMGSLERRRKPWLRRTRAQRACLERFVRKRQRRKKMEVAMEAEVEVVSGASGEVFIAGFAKGKRGGGSTAAEAAAAAVASKRPRRAS